MIEWMPRSRGDNGWRHLRPGPYRRQAMLEDLEGEPAVRVPVVLDKWFRAALRRIGPWVLLLVRVAFFGLVVIVWVARLLVERVGQVWPMLVVGGVLMLLGLGLVLYRLVRLRRWPSPGRRADLLVGTDGVLVGDLVVPWYQVERVVRFHLAAANPRRTRNFLALQVRDFVGVRGLTPQRAGLANLTRRRLVVLAEVIELSHAEELAAALDRLVADPSSRDLLTRPEGARLLDEGPAMVIWRSS